MNYIVGIIISVYKCEDKCEVKATFMSFAILMEKKKELLNVMLTFCCAKTINAIRKTILTFSAVILFW